MMKLTHQLPRHCYVAVSGGVDSMCVLHFLSRVKSRVLGILHVNHRTGEFSGLAQTLVEDYCKELEVPFLLHTIDNPPPKGLSKEMYWRDERYKFFHSFNKEVILAHHLNDCIEEYIMCTLVRGFMGTIPYSNKNCIRPFRLWSKQDLYKYAEDNKIPFIEDPSNYDIKYKRNLIRNKLLPVALELNPGLDKIVKRLIEKEK